MELSRDFILFKKDVVDFIKERPVILVDLPGQGGNTQQSGALDFEGFADLLKAFFDRTGRERVNLTGPLIRISKYVRKKSIPWRIWND